MRKSKAVRVVVDTNLWVSFLISGRAPQLDELLFEGRVKVLFSESLLDELSLTIRKPKLAKFFAPKAMEEMLTKLNDCIELVSVSSNVAECRDPNDDFLLALSLDGRADYLLTGDADLLVMKSFRSTRILTLKEFLGLIS